MRRDRVERRNRVGFALLGAALLAAGVVALLLRAGVLAGEDPSTLYERAQGALAGSGVLVAAGVAVLGVLLALIGFRVVLAQVPRPPKRLGRLVLQTGQPGATSVPARILARAVERDLERTGAVLSPDAVVVSAGAAPSVRVEAGVDGSVLQARERMEPAFQRLCTAAGWEAVDVEVVLRPVVGKGSRVR